MVNSVKKSFPRLKKPYLAQRRHLNPLSKIELADINNKSNYRQLFRQESLKPYDFHIATNIFLGLLVCLDAIILSLNGYFFFIRNQAIETYEQLPINLFIVLNVFYTVVAFYFLKLYVIESFIERKKTLLKIIVVCAFTCIIALPTVILLEHTNPYFSFKILFYWYICSAIAISLTHLFVGAFLIYMAQEGWFVRNIAIIGDGEQSSLMVEELKRNNHPWINIVGVFDDRSDERRVKSIGRNFKLGNVDTLVSMAREWRIDEIVIALPWGAEDRISLILNKIQVLPINIRLCPESICFKIPNYGYGNYSGIRILKILNKPISGWHYIVKTIEDIFLSTLIIILISPVMFLIALLIKIDSPGPVFFRQKRYGFNNNIIQMFKFRTMFVDKQDNNGSQLTTKNDPRVTKLGRILRRTSLDELPQFLNVLTGEMSIVGPRPHAREAKAAGKLYEDVVFQYAARHKVKPGITGWAQINGWRGETDTEEKILKRVEYDIDYINRWSLFFDLKIIAETIFVIVKGHNAY